MTIPTQLVLRALLADSATARPAWLRPLGEEP